MQFFLLSAIVIAATLCADAPALSARAMSFDDAEYLDFNPLVRSPSWQAAWTYIREVLHPSTVTGYYRPVTMLSFMLTRMGGTPENYYPFHRTNLILHALNAVLLFLLFWQLCGAPVAACVAACLFAVHPFFAEAVVWIAERKTLLGSFFALASLNAYVADARRPRRGIFIGAWVLYLLATLSKPTVIPLPLLLVLLDFWPLRRLSFRGVVRLAPFFIVAMRWQSSLRSRRAGPAASRRRRIAMSSSFSSSSATTSVSTLVDCFGLGRSRPFIHRRFYRLRSR
jgi:hypothetical protein